MIITYGFPSAQASDRAEVRLQRVPGVKGVTSVFVCLPPAANQAQQHQLRVDFEGARTYPLSQAVRCTGTIVSVYN